MNRINKNYSHKDQIGSVSLFVVVFAALLMTVVVVSFIRIVVNDQQQASTTDLSQSAYDSSQAGVEDGKRVLIMQQNLCSEGGNSVLCEKITADLETESQSCNQVLANLPSVSVQDGEVRVKQNANDLTLDQAYTCVKVTPDTADYLGLSQIDGSRVIPLVGEGSFDTVQIEWYTAEDLKSSTNTVNLLPGSSSELPLISQDKWTSSRPSVMRAQFMQVGDANGGFTLSDFDNTTGGSSDANTIFLYPVGTTGTALGSTPLGNVKSLIGNDARKTAIGAPKAITCSGVLNSGGYACKAQITLPQPINGGNRTAFLRLTSLYNGSHYRVSLLNAGNVVLFDGVQPEIDSTGRANDLFRRVKSRVELRDVNFPYPDAAVSVSGNLCKDFLITDKSSDFANYCKP